MNPEKIENSFELLRAIKTCEEEGPCEVCGHKPAKHVVGSVCGDEDVRAIALCEGCAERNIEMIKVKRRERDDREGG